MATFTLCVDAPLPRLQIVFERRADRFFHRVHWCGESGESLPLLESIESNADELWPASPVIQEVHLQELDGGSRGALCVGMAGKGHWSLGVRLAADGREVVFQAACRMRDVSEVLGSTYREVESLGANCLSLDPSPTTLMRTEGEQLIFSPRNVPTTAPQTAAWDYALAIKTTQ